MVTCRLLSIEHNAVDDVPVLSKLQCWPNIVSRRVVGGQHEDIWLHGTSARYVHLVLSMQYVLLEAFGSDLIDATPSIVALVDDIVASGVNLCMEESGEVDDSLYLLPTGQLGREGSQDRGGGVDLLRSSRDLIGCMGQNPGEGGRCCTYLAGLGARATVLMRVECLDFRPVELFTARTKKTSPTARQPTTLQSAPSLLSTRVN